MDYPKSSYRIYDGGCNVYHPHHYIHSFVKAEQTWLATSTAVDITLSLVLSIELWWARQKLGMQGGSMREIVTRLIVSIASCTISS